MVKIVMEERLDSFSNDSFRARAAALLAFGQRRLAAGGWARYREISLGYLGLTWRLPTA